MTTAEVAQHHLTAVSLLLIVGIPVAFWAALALVMFRPASSPILALRNRLRSLRDDKTRVDSETLMGLVFRAWNAWRDKKRVTSLPLYYKGEPIHCPEPH